MTKEVITVDSDKTIFDAAVLMSEKEIACLVVIDDKTPIGIVTERDFVRRVVSKKSLLNAKISEIMSKPLITVDPESSLRDAARLMINNKIRRLPVVKENKLVGVLVASDFTRQLGKKTITEEILEAMARYPLYAPEY